MRPIDLITSGLKKSWKGGIYKCQVNIVATVFAGVAVMFSSTSAFAKEEWVFRGDSAFGVLENWRTPTPEYGAMTPEEKAIGFFDASSIKDSALRARFGTGSLQQVKTSAGMLTAYAYADFSQILYLKDQTLVKAKNMHLVSACPEKGGLPSIILIGMRLGDEGYNVDNENFERIYVIDVGVSPPFISKDYLPFLTRTDFSFSKEETAQEKMPEFRKLDDDTYIISGQSWEEIEKLGKLPTASISYRYSRKDGTVTRVE